MKSKVDSSKDELKQQNVIQAVVIADNFNQNFHPLTLTKPAVLMPLVNETLLNYVLKSLEECGIQETFVFCCAHNQEIRNYINSSRWAKTDNPMSVFVLSSSTVLSLGDVLRELDCKALIRSDFVLIRGDVVTTLPLCDILEEHKNKRQIDKASAMTLICRKALPYHNTRCKEDDLVLALEPTSKKIRFYQRVANEKTVYIPLEVFLENDKITVHHDLLDCHISICSPCVPPLFSDNFDYQSLDDLVKGLLINEELLGNSMYLHVAERSGGYGASVSNLYMYNAVSQDIIGRWTYPIVPDEFKLNDTKCIHMRNNIYKENYVELGRHSTLQHNVVVGKGSRIGDNSFVANSVIGRNCSIGTNVSIRNSFLWNDVEVGDNCVLDTCLLADSVTLHQGVHVSAGCVLDNDVIIGENVHLPLSTRLHAHKILDENSFDDDFSDEETASNVCDIKLVGEKGHGYMYSSSNKDARKTSEVDVWSILKDENMSDDSSASSSSSVILSVDDDISVHSDKLDSEDDEEARMFFSEVLDSLQRGFKEGIKPENIILEINSSKYAYNVTMKEVNTFLMKSLLKMPFETVNGNLTVQQYLMEFKKVMKYYHPLISNYIRNAESQMDCLLSVEDFLSNSPELRQIKSNTEFITSNILHYLYDEDIANINEAVFVKWYDNLSEQNALKKQSSAFIKWLKEAEEESSED